MIAYGTTRMRALKAVLISLLFSLSAVALAQEASDARALADRMQKLEQALSNQALLDLAQRIATLQREVRELRGENERLAYELNSIKTLQREQYMAIERRLQSAGMAPAAGTTGVLDTSALGPAAGTAASPLPESQALLTSPPVEPASAPLSGQVVSQETSGEVAEDYKNAFTLLKGGKYDDSIGAFESFLRKHPNSKYAGNAQYWLAEANYVTRRYPQALVEFSRVVSKHPASSKLADARLKLAFTHYELGQFPEARTELTRLRAQFPNSSVASLAQQRLERMSREGH